MSLITAAVLSLETTGCVREEGNIHVLYQMMIALQWRMVVLSIFARFSGYILTKESGFFNFSFLGEGANPCSVCGLVQLTQTCI